jgi:eukaryotic-like serine/threonine-protein kinase
VAKVKLLDPADPRRKLDRYELIGEIATGGMATVYLARRSGVGGFQRFVAIKRLHPHLANEPEFVEMFLDEARLAALIHHPHVVPILEVGESDSGYYLVMEYVEGDTLSRLVARSMSAGQLPARHVMLRVVLDTLAGLHAAHELRDDRGQLLGLVHRDVSPQNVLVGVDGSARITDFGVARATARLTSTGHGKLKGKLAYMAPEQTRGDELDRRTDLFAMGIILWEVLVGKRLFKADSEAATLQRILVEAIRPPSSIVGTIPSCFDDVVLRALDRDPDRRFQSAADMADALESAAREAQRSNAEEIGAASPREVATFVQQVLGNEIGAQRESVRAWLAQSDSGQPVVVVPGPNGVSAGQGPTMLDAPGLGPSTTRDMPHPSPSNAGASSPGRVVPPAADTEREAAAPPVALVPRYDVAADVTMRFALEEPPSAEPRPSGGAPPPSSGPLVAKVDLARPVPPPKQSSPTLIGQPPPPRLPSFDSDLDAETRPHTSGLVAAGRRAGAVPLSDLADDDAVTIARMHSSTPPPAQGSAPPPSLESAVKTARGLFAEAPHADLESPARAASPGSVPPPPGEPASTAVSVAPYTGVVRTPRMPMPADVVQPVQPIAPVRSGESVRPLPRTLVSEGGFAPGSMTVTADSLASSANEPTMVRPKRRAGRYVIVVSVFLAVFGAGLFFLRQSRTPIATTTSTSTAATAAPTNRPDSSPTTAPTASSAPGAEPSSVPTTESTGSAPPADLAPPVDSATPTATTATSTPTPVRPRPRPTSTQATTPEPTSKPEPKPTSKPEPKPTSKPDDLDLGNPYR